MSLFISKIKTFFMDTIKIKIIFKVDSKLFNIKNVSDFSMNEKLKYNIKFKELDLNLDGILDFEINMVNSN